MEEIAWKITSLEEGNFLFWFTETDAECRSLAVQFADAGIARKEKLLVLGARALIQSGLVEEIQRRFDSSGMGLPGQLAGTVLGETGPEGREVRSTGDLLEFLRAETAGAIEQGFAAVRILVEVDSVFQGFHNSGECLDLVRNLEAFFPENRCTGLFLLDPVRMDPGVVTILLATQSTVGISEGLYQNPQAAPVSGLTQAGDLSRLLLHRFESQLAGRAGPKSSPDDSAWFHSIFNNMAGLAAVLSADGTLLRVNQAFLQATGCEPASVLGRPVWELPAWERQPQARADIQAAVHKAAGGEYVRVEVALDGRAVKELCFNLAIQPVSGPAGLPPLLICTGRNATVTKDLDRRVRDQDQLLDAVLGGAPLLIFLADREGKIRYSGAGTGTPVDGIWRALPGQFVRDSFADIPEVPLHFERALRGESFSTRFEQIGVTFDVRYSPARDDRGEICGAAAVAMDVTRQVRSEDALFKELSRFRKVFMDAPIGIQFLDDEGRLLDCNPAMLAMFGYSAEEMRGRSAVDLAIPKERARNRQELEGLLRGGTDQLEGERTCQRKDGSQLRVRERFYRSAASTGESSLAFALVEDISERVQAEIARLASETRLRGVLSGFPGIILAADRGAAITLCEGRGLGALGAAPETFAGRPIREVFGERPDLQGCWERSLAGEDVSTLETISDRVYEARYSPLRDSQGEVAGLVGILIDVSERKEVEIELRRQVDLLKQALDKMPIGIWFTDEKGKIRSGNPAGQALWGAPDSARPEWFTGQKAWFAGTGKPVETGDWAVARAVEKGETTLNETLEIETGEGARKTILSSAIPLYGEDQQIVAAVVVNEDITERVHTERELAEVRHRLLVNAESERLRLAQDLHDGPIQDLYGITFQLNELQDALEHTELKPVAVSADETLREVIGVLRRMCSEMRPPTLVPFGLEKAIRSHTESFCRRNTGLAVHLELEPDGQQLPEQVRIGLFRIYQEVLNNIVKHAQATQVNVYFGLDVEYGWLEVADNGHGFEVPQRWVDLVRQGHLGLVGIQERTEALGGSFALQSSAGGGTRIRVVIPRDAAGEGFLKASLKQKFS